METNSMNERLLRRREVEKITGLSRSSIYRLMEISDFPRPVRIGPGAMRWKLSVTPEGGGTVTIVLPETTDCTAQGAICTQDRRPLSNTLEVTVPGPDG